MSEKERVYTCKHHGSFDPKRQWGCPDCLRELRAERDRFKEIAELALMMWGMWNENHKLSAARTKHANRIAALKKELKGE